MNNNEILHNLSLFNGSENLFKHQIGNISINYTDGILYLAENTNCYWLLDIILSYQPSPILKNDHFQVWKLIKNNNSWIIACSDGDNNLLLDQDIEYSDFPFNTITLWFVNDVLMLPSEY